MNTVREKAFTLIELLVVVAIISLLSSVVLASLNGARERARDARRLQDFGAVSKQAMTQYNIDTGEWPSQTGYVGSGCPDGPLSVLVDGGYLQSIPTDPADTINQCSSRPSPENSSEDIFHYAYDDSTYQGYTACFGIRNTETNVGGAKLQTFNNGSGGHGAALRVSEFVHCFGENQNS